MSNNLTLGTTTIRDLLINHKLTQSFPKTDADIKLKIPKYQRPYKWTVKNVNQLIDDLNDAMLNNKEVYRVGTLILHKNESADPAGNKTPAYDIVDGQQRTISLTLLLKALCAGTDDEKKLDFLDEELPRNVDTIHNIVTNFRAVERRFTGKNEEENKRIRRNLADFIENRCEFIVVITDDLSEAFQFFDSQNARGKSLYPHDLLKAYHLREMQDVGEAETERVVKYWEEMDQASLADLFSEYLYRVKKWMKGDYAGELTSSNIDMFKGATARDNYPFAQYAKSAFAYASEINRSHVPFVTGIQHMNPFQINAPIIAGQPFFEYSKHYFDVLADIRNNDKYNGYFVNDIDIVKTLDSRRYKNGIGNGIARKMFDTALLLYVDRFCQEKPSNAETEYLNHFLNYVFIWAYSMRAQYKNVGWSVAQNYIMGNARKDSVVNSFNIYKMIIDADTPSILLSRVADKLVPLNRSRIGSVRLLEDIHAEKDGIYQNYLHFFDELNYWEG